MRPITLTLTNQTSAPVPLDVYLTPFSVSVAFQVTGSVAATLQYTMSDVFAKDYVAASDPGWKDFPGMINEAADKLAHITQPLRAIRVASTNTGTTVVRIAQAGIQ